MGLIGLAGVALGGLLKPVQEWLAYVVGAGRRRREARERWNVQAQMALGRYMGRRPGTMSIEGRRAWRSQAGEVRAMVECVDDQAARGAAVAFLQLAAEDDMAAELVPLYEVAMSELGRVVRGGEASGEEVGPPEQGDAK